MQKKLYLCALNRIIVSIYFLFIRIAALFGHRKARLMVEGQKKTAALLDRCAVRSETAGAAGSKIIWFHAASVGEFEQARPVIEHLTTNDKRQTTKIIVTFFSPSGYELRKNYALADKVMYLPFATRRNAKRFLNAVQPDMAIFVKYEFWPAYLRALRKRKIPTYLISGIFTPKQLFFRPWGVSYRRLLRCFTTLFVQDESSRELLSKYGFENVVVAGDTRFDRVATVSCQTADAVGSETASLLDHFADSSANVIVAGSTWPADEALLAQYIETHEDVKLILVPHEIDEAHLHHIFQLFQGRFVRFTEATPLNIRHVRVLVVDTVGLLSKLYRYGQAAYVGGGFGVGIHNTLEPAVYGMPVLFGPNHERFREALGLKAAGAGFAVNNYASFEAAMDDALAHHEEYGQKAKAYIDSELGATDTILNNLTI